MTPDETAWPFDDEEELSDAARLGRMLYAASVILDVQLRIVGDLTRPGGAPPEYLAGLATSHILAAQARDALAAVGGDVTEHDEAAVYPWASSHIASVIASYEGQIMYLMRRLETHYEARMLAQGEDT
jgi:hypothetical protein